MLKDQGKSGKKSIVFIKLQQRNVDTFNLQENIDLENAQVDESLFSSARDCCCNGDALSGGKTNMLLMGLSFFCLEKGKT